MIVFTIIGLLVFWVWCFQIGYSLIPTYMVVRAGWAVFLFGREAEHVIAILAASGVTGTSTEQEKP